MENINIEPVEQFSDSLEEYRKVMVRALCEIMYAPIDRNRATSESAVEAYFRARKRALENRLVDL